MRTRLFIFLLGLSHCLQNNAQEASNLPQKKFMHHEISVSYGLLPVSDWTSIAEEALFPVLTFGLVQRKDTRFTGAFNLSYMYRLNSKISFGVLGGFTSNKGFIGDFYHENQKVRDDRKYFYVLPTFRYNWFRYHDLSLYSSAAAGTYFLTNKIGEETNHKTRFAYQVNWFGIEYGKRLVVFAELGFGNAGTIMVGARLRF